MRVLAAVLAAALSVPAYAQAPPPPPNQGIQAQPLAPPGPARNQGIQSQAPGQPAPGPGIQAQPLAPPAPAPPPQWEPRATAELEVLDKLEATSRTLKVAVGQSVQAGSLTIAVKECVVRPPDLAPDAAAYLVITDSNPGEPGFQGWMLKDEPWVAMLQSPLYDVRVIGCS